MLPIGNNQYLEIVTIFHGDHRKPNDPWKRDGVDQLRHFIKELESEERGLELTWGSRP